MDYHLQLLNPPVGMLCCLAKGDAGAPSLGSLESAALTLPESQAHIPQRHSAPNPHRPGPRSRPSQPLQQGALGANPLRELFYPTSSRTARAPQGPGSYTNTSSPRELAAFPGLPHLGHRTNSVMPQSASLPGNFNN